MKLFWTIITIFTLAAAAMVWAQARVEHSGPALLTEAASMYGPQGSTRDPLIASTPSRNAAEWQEGERGFAGSEFAAPEAGSKDDLARELVDDLLTDEPPMVVTRGPGPGGDAGTHTGHQEQIAAAENPWAVGEKQVIEHSIEQQPDGSTLIDGLFTIRGNGTAVSPYEITWDLLMSAAETYQPRLGMNELPERIKMLDGKHVKIAGFLMFPMATFEAKEALVMLNMWDGCCIGTMPSPYDAIEVQFTQSVPSSVRQFASYGSVEGKLVVDPYLISDWLIGLYVLEEAKLDVGM